MEHFLPSTSVSIQPVTNLTRERLSQTKRWKFWNFKRRLLRLDRVDGAIRSEGTQRILAGLFCRFSSVSLR